MLGGMGGAKRELEEIEARGWAAGGKRICSDCVHDYYLKSVIAADEKEGIGNCSFCGSERSATVNTLLDPLVDGIRFAYEDALNVLSYVSSEGGFVGGSTFDTWDILHDELSAVFENADIPDYLYSLVEDKTWVRRGEPRRDVDEVLVDAWGRFCHAH